MKSLRSLFGRILPLIGFRGSRDYWETRYSMGGHSGEGSRGANADYKAKVINGFIASHGVESAIEFGCGDGHQLGMLDLRRYVGIDVSRTIVEQCRDAYRQDPTKQFLHDSEFAGGTYDLSMSIDVIFHLVEDEVYDAYMARLFASAARYVVIYSTDADMASTGTPHVRHRHVSRDVEQRFPGFRRMAEDGALPPPVRYDRGLPTVFRFYERIS